MYIKVIEENKEKFEQYNKIKFERFQQLIPNAQVWRIINSIPYLLHVNDHRMPEYIDDDVPCGVASYYADEDTKRFLRSKFHGLKTPSADQVPFVQMLAVMGSIGTIAYNKKSDFDYWVCVNKDSVGREAYLKFRKKVEEIQKWAESQIKLPVHLFINDIESVKQNIFDEDEDEAFGSTIGALLKDEFYRSSIIIAGKIPFWWVVPQFAQDAEYEELYNRLPADFKKNHFINLGNLYKISKEDFLGAALFQIIKSLGNPFKSIIKLGVLEKYIFGQENLLISQKVKVNIHRGNIGNTVLDSYLMMFREVYEFYKKNNNDDILSVLRQNLYLKIDPQLSKYLTIKDRSNIPYKVAEMFRSVKEWGWKIDEIKSLDNFDNWDFNEVMKFWDKVQASMLMSYQKITTQLPKLNLQQIISESDFKLLSRKIKSHYSRQKGKIEQFLTFKDTSYEPLLYIEPVNQGIHEVEWRLYKRNTSEMKTFTSTTIKTSNNLIDLLVWTALNRIFEPKISRVSIQSGYSRINQHVVVGFMTELSQFFNEERMKIKNKFILEPVSTYLNFIVLNFNEENHSEIKSVHHVYHTSWGESFIKKYDSSECIPKILVTVVRDGVRFNKKFDEFCKINAPDPYKKLYRDISQLFKEAFNFVVENDKNSSHRFISKIEGNYIVITRDGEKVDAGIYPSYFKLVAALTLRPHEAISYNIHNYLDHTLGTLEYINNVKDSSNIHIFYEERGNYIFAYIVNEKGNIFGFFDIKGHTDLLLSYLFAVARHALIAIKKINPGFLLEADSIKVFKIATDRFEKISVFDESQKRVGKFLASFKGKGGYTVSITRLMGDEPFYNVVFPDKVESGFMTIKELYSVAEKLKNLIESGQCAGNYISRVDFLDRKKNANDDTTPFFLEKYKIQFMVDKFINKK